MDFFLLAHLGGAASRAENRRLVMAWRELEEEDRVRASGRGGAGTRSCVVVRQRGACQLWSAFVLLVGIPFLFLRGCASLTCCLLLILYDRFLCTVIDCPIAFGISLFGIFLLTDFVAKTRSLEVLVSYGAQYRLLEHLIAAAGVEAFKAKHAATVNFPADIAPTKVAVKHMSTIIRFGIRSDWRSRERGCG